MKKILKIRLGIIGVGNIGSAHVESIRAGLCPEIELIAAADRRTSRREWVQKQMPGIRKNRSPMRLRRSRN